MRERQAHWIKHNQQERIPPRMVAFDCESKAEYDGDTEIQSFRTCASVRWRTDLTSGDHAEAKMFGSPEEFWAWVSSYCRKGTRTVVWAHNLGYDVRISQVFTLLPQLGFELEWCNLDRNVSSMTWRSDHGTLVFADTWTWLPLPLNVIAPQVGMVKYDMPKGNADTETWRSYCRNDAEIVYHVVSDLIAFISNEGLGNWQPTGAGMAYATWRHRFMPHKVLVHDDKDAIRAERAAMYTGRAEAWRHGKLRLDRWTEVDLRNAYVTIASECDLPRKLHMHTGKLSMGQYAKLHDRFAMLCYCDIRSDVPALPYRAPTHFLWPVGEFPGWYWDTEVNSALDAGANITIKEAYAYVRSPCLRDWARWVLHSMRSDDVPYSTVAKTYLKHCSRAFIGRLSLRVPSWEVFGGNPEGFTGISHVTFPEEGRTSRLLHVGDKTLIETAREEGKDSLPQITGWIMAECRARLWRAMTIAGFENLAHVDTDSLIVNTEGLTRLRDHYGEDFAARWTIKGTWRNLEVIGPRAYFRDGSRAVAGIPRKAEKQADGSYRGERWASVSSDLEAARGEIVTVTAATWHLKRTDPRRRDSPGAGTLTEPYQVTSDSSFSSSSSPTPGAGS